MLERTRSCQEMVEPPSQVLLYTLDAKRLIWLRHSGKILNVCTLSVESDQCRVRNTNVVFVCLLFCPSLLARTCVISISAIFERESSATVCLTAWFGRVVMFNMNNVYVLRLPGKKHRPVLVVPLLFMYVAAHMTFSVSVAQAG